MASPGQDIKLFGKELADLKIEPSYTNTHMNGSKTKAERVLEIRNRAQDLELVDDEILRTDLATRLQLLEGATNGEMDMLELKNSLETYERRLKAIPEYQMFVRVKNEIKETAKLSKTNAIEHNALLKEVDSVLVMAHRFRAQQQQSQQQQQQLADQIQQYQFILTQNEALRAENVQLLGQLLGNEQDNPHQ